jgi:hypothetical protein
MAVLIPQNRTVSTVLLPSAVNLPFWQNAGMSEILNLLEILTRIKRRLGEVGLSASAIAARESPQGIF